MNRKEFMERLEKQLYDVSDAERQEALEYYAGYMDEAGIGEDDEVPDSIGTPEKVAKELKRSILNPDTDFMADEKVNINPPLKKDNTKSSGSGATHKKKSNMSGTELAIVIIAAILTLPIWGSILIAVGATAFGLFIAAIAVVFSLAVTAFVLIVVGLWVGGVGIGALITGSALGSGLCTIAAGLMVAAAGIVFTVGIINFIVVFIPWIFRGIGRLIRRITGKGGKA